MCVCVFFLEGGLEKEESELCMYPRYQPTRSTQPSPSVSQSVTAVMNCILGVVCALFTLYSPAKYRYPYYPGACRPRFLFIVLLHFKLRLRCTVTHFVLVSVQHTYRMDYTCNHTFGPSQPYIVTYPPTYLSPAFCSLFM
jgi:hypothetical protein